MRQQDSQGYGNDIADHAKTAPRHGPQAGGQFLKGKGLY